MFSSEGDCNCRLRQSEIINCISWKHVPQRAVTKNLWSAFLVECQGDTALGLLWADPLAAFRLLWRSSHTGRAMHKKRNGTFYLIVVFVAAVFPA